MNNDLPAIGWSIVAVSVFILVAAPAARHYSAQRKMRRTNTRLNTLKNRSIK